MDVYSLLEQKPCSAEHAWFPQAEGERDAPRPGSCHQQLRGGCTKSSCGAPHPLPSCLGEGRARLLSTLSKFLGFGKLISLDEQLELNLAPALCSSVEWLHLPLSHSSNESFGILQEKSSGLGVKSGTEENRDESG